MSEPVDREQIALAAKMFLSMPEAQHAPTADGYARSFADHCLALLAELEQAEKERDLEPGQEADQLAGRAIGAINQLNRYAHDLEARLAKVPALVEAASELLDYYQNPEAKRSTVRLIELEDGLSLALSEWERE